MAERVIATTRTPEKKQNCQNSCKQKPGSSSSGSPADRILQLQRTAGNQAVQRLVKSRELQAKLKISQPNDVYEQEADRVAEQVMNLPEPRVQRQPEGGGGKEKETIRTKPLIFGIAPLAQKLAGNKEGEKGEEKEEIFRAKESGNDSPGPGFQNRITQLKGGGNPLPETARKSMESRFGTDLSAVKVHTGSGASGLAREINAKAFTSGKDIYFGDNQFRPGTGGGDKLLAHEMTHVIQQKGDSSGSVSRVQMFSDAENTVIARKDGDSSAKADTKAASTAAGDTAPGIVELKGISEFKPSEQVSNYFNEKQAGNVQVRFGNLAEGVIKVKKSKGKSDSESYRIDDQAISLKHPIFAGLDPGPNLILNTNKGLLQGYVGIGKGGSEAFINQLKEYPERIGLPGFNLLGGGKLSNKLENGVMEFGFEGVPIKLGGAFSGTLTLKAVNENVTFNGNANINVGGLGSGSLVLNRSEEGLVKGEAKVGVKLTKNVTGEVTVFWTGEVIEGQGNVGYQGEKLSGNVLLKVMERKEAERLATEKKAPPGEEATGKNAVKTRNKHSKLDYAVFGEGDLTFSFTEWLNGTAHTIVDQNGFVTVIGKITPQKEFELFPQKDYNKDLFKLEARASYGIPVVGNIFIFANVGMGAFAKIGPAKFYKIEVDGTYSTDPKKNNDFSIRGSLNISAAAGLKLRGEAGAGLEVLAHDVKAGAGINGIAGINGYAEATPIIGYREKGAGGEDKKGEFFIHGELEIAAQPFLGLSGDLFVELDSPWWSPAPDKKWTWPLFGKEWPIGGNLGIGASVDYVFGSGIPPAVEFKPVEFSADKFLTDLYSDKSQPKSGEKEPQKGGWAEKNSKGAEPPAKAIKKGNAQLGKAPEPPKAKSKVQPGGGKKAKKDVDPNAKTKEGKTVKQLQDEAAKKGKKAERKTPKGKEPKGKGEEKGKPEDKEKVAQMAKDKVKAELKTKLPKGAQQAADVNKVLNNIAPQVKPSLTNLHAEEVNPGKPKNEGAPGFKVKGKEEKGGDVPIDLVRYSQEGKVLSHEERWNKGVEEVKKIVSKMVKRDISEKAIKDQFPKWKSDFGFTALYLNTEKTPWLIEGEMSRKKRITYIGGAKLTWVPTIGKRLIRYAQDVEVHREGNTLTYVGRSGTSSAVWFVDPTSGYDPSMAAGRPYVVELSRGWNVHNASNIWINFEGALFKGEAKHPDHIIVKENEPGAYGIGKNLIAGLLGSMKVTEQKEKGSKGKETKVKGEENGKPEDKENSVKFAMNKVKAELKTQLPKGARQVGDVYKVLSDVAPKVKPSLSSLYAEEVMPGEPKNEGAIGFKVKGKEEGKEEKGKDVLIDSVRYSKEGTVLSHEERWKKGVEEVTKLVKKLTEREISEETIKAQLPKWQHDFGFSNLSLNTKETPWVIEGEMSKRRKITKVEPYSIARIDEIQKKIDETLKYSNGKKLEVSLELFDSNLIKAGRNRDLVQKFLFDLSIEPKLKDIIKPKKGTLIVPGELTAYNYEVHHIIPLWLKGTDGPENYVLLPANVHHEIQHAKLLITKLIGETVRGRKIRIYLPDFRGMKYVLG